ncbi:uncharacterized protein LOC101847121 isoform X2 [Aplysia californica]|uniref:Protein FAM33A n=1 Tax=Aplysia californica TaxID=6500 RepID=A0ABM1A3N8_APLCA|nr:uncharacterized protein LOC101847121 isoform X2 [Aplysia californica]
MEKAVAMEKAVDNLESMHNPVKLMRKLEGVKTEFASLVQDVSEIQTAQKEAVDFFRTQLLSLTQMLGKLETDTGCGPELSEATVGQFEELADRLGIPKEEILPPSDADSPAGDVKSCHGAAENAQAVPSKTASTSSATESTESSDASKEELSPELSAYDLRADNPEFVELTKKEFMSVSELVRGRSKLEEVNKTFRLLWQHFKEEGNTDALTPKDMNAKGMRVTGATGVAKVKVLRALKLCSISKEGNVKLL